MNSPGLTAQLVAAFACVVLSLTLLYVMFRVVRGAWRRVCHFFGPEGLRSVSFLIVSPVLLTVLLPGLQKMLLLGCALLLGVPASFVQREATALSSPQAAAGQAAAGHDSFTATLAEAFASLSRDYSQLLIQHSWSDSKLLLKIVLFLVLWGTVGQMLKVIIALPEERSATFKGTDARANFEAFVKKLRSWKPWLALGGLLAVGLYLTLASIAGIGELNEKPTGNDPDISLSGLRQGLQSFQLTEDRLASTHPKDILPMSQPLQTLLELEKAVLPQSSSVMDSQGLALPPIPTNTAIPGQPVVTPIVPSEKVLQHVQHVKQKRAELKTRWEQLRLNVLLEERNALELALKRFELGSYSMPYPERVQYYMDILHWYERRSSLRQSELTDCSRSISKVGQHLDTWAEAVTRPQSIALVPSDFDSAIDEASQQCSLSRLEPVPPPTSRSTHLRVVFLPMSWIRESRSVSPALIIGMIGVGLLGSVVSSFIQSPRTSSREHAGLKFPEMTGVVLRGVSAALVVFLLVQASLATMFVQQKPSPNPYVVLFLCFVAAVFSKYAWSIARRRFASCVGDDNSPVPTPQSPSKEQP